MKAASCAMAICGWKGSSSTRWLDGVVGSKLLVVVALVVLVAGCCCCWGVCSVVLARTRAEAASRRAAPRWSPRRLACVPWRRPRRRGPYPPRTHSARIDRRRRRDRWPSVVATTARDVVADDDVTAVRLPYHCHRWPVNRAE